MTGAWAPRCNPPCSIIATEVGLLLPRNKGGASLPRQVSASSSSPVLSAVGGAIAGFVKQDVDGVRVVGEVHDQLSWVATMRSVVPQQLAGLPPHVLLHGCFLKLSLHLF